MTHSRSAAALARTTVVLLAALVLAGCGSDDSPQPSSRGGGEQLTVTETDFELDPADARLDRSGSVAIEVVNDGKAPHALALEIGGDRPSTGTIDPGKIATLKADLEPGRYTWYCPVANHRALGMTGTLTVGGDAGGNESEPSAPASPGGGGY